MIYYQDSKDQKYYFCIRERKSCQMFDYKYMMQQFNNFDEMKESRKYKFLNGLLHDDDFMEYLFNPKKTENTESEIMALYQQVCKPKVVRTLSDMIEEVGYDRFDRSVATFINSICNQGLMYNNERLNEASANKRTGDIDNKAFRQISEKAEKYNSYIAELLKCSRKIVKREARELASDSGLPKYICTIALRTVPETKYVKPYKVTYYLSALMNNIYSEVDKIGDFSDNVNWRIFFRTVFGKENSIEAATFILLEGVHRIDKYKNNKDVHACWDSLTSYALRELNDAPDQLRNQMIELYIKRVAKMFANRAFDLRVDLLHIDEDIFPKLVKSIGGYADKLTEILNGESKN